MRLGCKGAERAGPSRGGAGGSWGGAGLRLPGAPGWPVPPLLYTWCCRLPGGVRGWSRPPAYRGQRGPLQTPVGSATRFPGHRYQSVQRAGTLNRNRGQRGMGAKQGTIKTGTSLRHLHFLWAHTDSATNVKSFIAATYKVLLTVILSPLTPILCLSQSICYSSFDRHWSSPQCLGPSCHFLSTAAI